MVLDASVVEVEPGLVSAVVVPVAVSSSPLNRELIPSAATTMTKRMTTWMMRRRSALVRAAFRSASSLFWRFSRWR